MIIPQISVFLINKPGRLHALCESLAKANINLLSMTLADSGEFGLIRLIVSKPKEAVQILEDSGLAATITDVVACEVSASKGGLAKLLSTPAGKLKIDYAYAYPTPSKKDVAVMIFRFNDPNVAISKLKASGVKILSAEELLQDDP